MAGVDPQVAQKQLDKANLLTGITGAFGAVGALVTGLGAYNNALSRATVYAANAAVIRATIPQAQAAGAQQVDFIREDTAQLISAQRAALAANGIVVDQDTGLDAMIQAAGVGAKDVMTAVQNSRNEILKLRNQANQAEYEAKLAKREGRASILEGVGKAGMTILGAASTIAYRNTRMTPVGAPK